MALDNNPDLAADRIDPQIAIRVAAASGVFRQSSAPLSDNQPPPSNPGLSPAGERSAPPGRSQPEPAVVWRHYSLGWTLTHTNSNILNSYNPLVQSGLSVAVSQPLIRNLSFDSNRQQLATSKTNRDISDTRLRESLVHTTANVKAAYWNLVSARDTVNARRSTLDLAQELVRVNKAKVDVGTSPPLDLVSAQAEVAADQEQLIIAETTVKEAEDRLRLLIFDTGNRESWNVAIETVDSPPITTASIDLEAGHPPGAARRPGAAVIEEHRPRQVQQQRLPIYEWQVGGEAPAAKILRKGFRQSRPESSSATPRWRTLWTRAQPKSITSSGQLGAGAARAVAVRVLRRRKI